MSFQDLPPVRKGVQLCLTLDPGAVALLEQLCPRNTRGILSAGRLLSTLIYEHVARIETRRELLAELRAEREAVAS